MTRSLWKGIFYDISLHTRIVQNIQTLKKKTPVKIRTWSKRSTIPREWIGQRVEVYNGIRFIPVTIRDEMINHKIGEFVFTRKRATHKKKIAKKK